MMFKSQFPDFFRLAKDLRAMKFNFEHSKPRKPQRITVTLPNGQPSQEIVKDANGKTLYEWDPEEVIADDVPLEQANLLTSRHRFGRSRNEGKGIHRVVLDIDHDAALIPSTTPGHHHLLIDIAIEWPQYMKLLTALAEAGVIQGGYANASIAKGFTAIRPPWEKKTKKKEIA